MDTPASRACGIHAARLNLADYAANFSDAHPPLTRPQALIEAERCYYCHDAPCATACPTGIDIRNGTQLECTNCTACIDACDTIMEKINKPWSSPL